MGKNTVEYDINETKIPMPGIFRCCLASVAIEFIDDDNKKGKKVDIGTKSYCKHCNREFMLTTTKAWLPVDGEFDSEE